jgi:hypothetical protein
VRLHLPPRPAAGSKRLIRPRESSVVRAAGLIDDYVIVPPPILLADGIPLWRGSDAPVMLEAAGAKVWSDGLIEVRYRGTPGGTA